MKANLYFIVFIFSSTVGWTQDFTPKKSTLVHLGYGLVSPYSKLPFNTGGFPSIGLDYYWSKGFFLGLDLNYMFGSSVRNDILKNLRTPEGHIYGNNQSIADIQLGWRGLYSGISWGKAFQPKGFSFSLGAGWMQYRYRIQEDPQTYVPQIAPPYTAGYEQLSIGWAFKQWVGYQHLDADNYINFKIGILAYQAFTQLKNNYQLAVADYAKQRPHLFVGLNFSWILPFYSLNPDTISY